MRRLAHDFEGLERVGVGHVVAVVSGRAAADARNMVGIDGLTYIGNHGLEIWSGDGPQLVPEVRPWVPRLASVLDDVSRQLETGVVQDVSNDDEDDTDTVSAIEPGGVIIENKGATASLHYRLARDPDAMRRELLQILARCAVTSGLRIEEGRRVINLLPPLTVTKGSAVSWLVREHGLDRLVYLGDDVTDAHAFKALKIMRESAHPVQTLGIGVIGSETPPIVRQLADASVASVEAVAELLSEVLDGLRSSATMETRAPSVGST